MAGAVSGDRGCTVGASRGPDRHIAEYPELDKLLGPIRAGDFPRLGGAPSMGKTSLALSIANRAADKGTGVAIASLEMTGQSLGFPGAGRGVCGALCADAQGHG